METLANLESFVRSAEHGSFSEAARRLGLTPAAVSRNVAVLERNLGVQLFRRTTRKLALTEAGEVFRASIGGSLETIQAAIERLATDGAEPAGTLRVSLSPTFGVEHVLPLLPGFLARYPRIRPEWHFENRAIDIVAEGYDAAIGGGFDLAPGVVARTLAPAHVIAVATPAYVAARAARVVTPGDLAGLDGIVMRSQRTGRVRHWTMRDSAGREAPAILAEAIVVDDPRAMREAALLGLGVTMLAVPDVLPALEAGTLVRVLPRWYADAGAISIYHASRALPAKTRAFADWVFDALKAQQLTRSFAASGRRSS